MFCITGVSVGSSAATRSAVPSQVPPYPAPSAGAA